MQILRVKYIQYNKAMETEHSATPLWVLAKLINKNLFGEFKKDINFQTTIIAQITSSMKHLKGLIKKFDVE